MSNSQNTRLEEVQYARELIVETAVKAGIATTILGSVAVLGLSRVSPLINNITVPGKVFLVSASGVAGSSIAAERRLLAYRKEKREARVHPLLQNKEVHPAQKAQMEKIQSMSTWDVFTEFEWKNWLITKKYYVVGGIWAASMVGSLAISFSNPHLKVSQKLIHARMYAQGITVTAALASALLAPFDHKKEEEENLAADKYRFDHLEMPPERPVPEFVVHEKTTNHRLAKTTPIQH